MHTYPDARTLILVASTLIIMQAHSSRCKRTLPNASTLVPCNSTSLLQAHSCPMYSTHPHCKQSHPHCKHTHPEKGALIPKQVHLSPIQAQSSPMQAHSSPMQAQCKRTITNASALIPKQAHSSQM